jgi:hypothetical protein
LGGCSFSDWVRWEARLVREESGDEEISAHACQELGMAGYFLILQEDKQSAIPFHACRPKLSVGDD